MYLLKKFYSKKDFFSLGSSRAVLIDKGGRCFLEADPGAKIELISKISLPRSPALGIGSSMRRFHFNFILLKGQISPPIEVKLVRERFILGSAVQTQEIECKSLIAAEKENEMMVAAADHKIRRFSWQISAPEFDNQIGEESIQYSFNIKWTFSGNTYYSPEVHICGLELEYEFKMLNFSSMGSDAADISTKDVSSASNSNTTNNIPVKDDKNNKFFTVTTLYVNKTGNDKVADGSTAKPFLTIPAALAMANLDASINKKYAIIVGPGTYDQPFSLPANIFITGVERNIVRIDVPNLNIDHPSWDADGDIRGGFSNCVIVGPSATLNFSKRKNIEAKVLFTDCLINNGLNVISAGNNQVRLNNCILFLDSLNQHGGVIQCFNTHFLSKNQMIIKGRPECQTRLDLYGGSGSTSFNISNELEKYQIDLNKPLNVNFNGFCSTAGRITARGDKCSINVASSCLAEEPSISHGATSNYNNKLLYKLNEDNKKYWKEKPPIDLQEAIDRILPHLPNLI